MYIVVSSLIIFSLISWYAIRHSSKKAYILDKNLSGLVAGISTGATSNSGFIVVAAVGMGYSMGMKALFIHYPWLIGDLIFWFFCAEKIVAKSHSSKSLSVPEFVVSGIEGKKEHKQILLKVMAVFIGIFLMMYLIAQFVSIEKSATFFTDYDSIVPMLVILGFVIFYSSIGGFIASVYTDVVQGIMMLILALGVLLWSLNHLGGIFEFISLVHYSSPELLNLNGAMTWLETIVFVFAFGFLGFGFNIAQPQVTSRIMAIRDKKQAKIARYVYISFEQFTWMAMCLIGFMAKFIVSGAEDPETALPKLAMENFHPVVVTFVMAGILATIISTLDSLLVAISNSFSYDVFGIGKTNDKLIYSRIFMIVTGAIAVMLSVFSSESVMVLSLMTVNLLTGTIGVAIVLRIFFNKLDYIPLVFSLGIGLISTLSWRFLEFNSQIGEGVAGFIIGIISYFLLLKLMKRRLAK